MDNINNIYIKEFENALNNNRDNYYKPYMLDRLKNWLLCYLNNHSKVFLIRITLKFPKNYRHDFEFPYISRFSQKITQFFSRKHYDPSYFWCREQAFSNNPHFHFCFLMNGQKIQCPVIFTNKAKSLWQSTLGTLRKGIINHDCSISLRKNDEAYPRQLNLAIDKILYLCKVYSKGEIKDGYRDFGMSRFNTIEFNTYSKEKKQEKVINPYAGNSEIDTAMRLIEKVFPEARILKVQEIDERQNKLHIPY